MMSDKKTVKELKEASKKPFPLLRGERQHGEDKAEAEGMHWAVGEAWQIQFDKHSIKKAIELPRSEQSIF